MPSFSSLVILVSASIVSAWSPIFERASPGCSADNCLRAITGTQPGQNPALTVRMQDCSSFLLKTVTPNAVTITTTASFISSTTSTLLTTTTSTTTAQLNNNKRDAVTISPSNVPTYASTCSGVVRYSSACSCAGVTGKTITVSAPTVTHTVSATLTTIIDVVSTSTSIEVAVPSSAAAASSPSCPPDSNIGASDYYGDGIFTQFFSGYGVSENSVNGGDQYDIYNAPLHTTLDGSLQACDAVVQCIDFVFRAYDYVSMDIHWLIAEKMWSCNAWDSTGTLASDFNVEDSNVGVVYGYQQTYYNYNPPPSEEDGD